MYNSYLTEKIPNHATENANSYIENTMRAYMDAPALKGMTIDPKPKMNIIDIATPFKVTRRPKSQNTNILQNKNKELSAEKSKNDVNKSDIITDSNMPKSLRPKFCIKYGCNKVDPD